MNEILLVFKMIECYLGVHDDMDVILDGDFKYGKQCQICGRLKVKEKLSDTTYVDAKSVGVNSSSIIAFHNGEEK